MLNTADWPAIAAARARDAGARLPFYIADGGQDRRTGSVARAHLPALDDGRLLATFERAAARFWGTLTFGAHCNGYLADAHGRPTHLWIARRSFTKPTDPGLLDNLVGGGVPHGQSPFDCVRREGWEEAGLSDAESDLRSIKLKCRVKGSEPPPAHHPPD